MRLRRRTGLARLTVRFLCAFRLPERDRFAADLCALLPKCSRCLSVNRLLALAIFFPFLAGLAMIVLTSVQAMKTLQTQRMRLAHGQEYRAARACN